MVIGEPISVFKEAVERETGILTEVDTYDWDHHPAHERRWRSLQPLFWQAKHWQDEDQGRDGPERGHPPEYVNKMQQEVFEILAEARCLEDLRRIESKSRQVYRR